MNFLRKEVQGEEMVLLARSGFTPKEPHYNVKKGTPLVNKVNRDLAIASALVSLDSGADVMGKLLTENVVELDSGLTAVETKLKKDELRIVAEEIGLVVNEGMKKSEFRRLIEDSYVFKNDNEAVKSAVEDVLENRNKKSDQDSEIEIERLKIERIKLEIQLAQVKANGNNTSFDQGWQMTSKFKLEKILEIEENDLPKSKEKFCMRNIKQ
ncbi:uncharacterized protein NPIL_67171 [Nephila pilipes]|uniref:Uncharacterized protein n=1 Tax=Nephila pilipes TaxID=299642 RepID=A0A8X6MSN3_NEPPI|nr:uncharacterized protein NPIL_67171 [Nephila pilipes]